MKEKLLFVAEYTLFQIVLLGYTVEDTAVALPVDEPSDWLLLPSATIDFRQKNVQNQRLASLAKSSLKKHSIIGLAMAVIWEVTRKYLSDLTLLKSLLHDGRLLGFNNSNCRQRLGDISA